MQTRLEKLFKLFIGLLTVLAVAVLGFVIFFIVKEALPLFKEVSLGDFLLGTRWLPIAYAGEATFGIFNFIAATLVVSFLAMIIAAFAGIGAAIFLSCVASEKARSLLYPFIDLLAGIPSVIYGFIGLVVLVRLFMKGRRAYRLLRDGRGYIAEHNAAAIHNIIMQRNQTQSEATRPCFLKRDGHIELVRHCACRAARIVGKHNAFNDIGHRPRNGRDNGRYDGHRQRESFPAAVWQKRDHCRGDSA